MDVSGKHKTCITMKTQRLNPARLVIIIEAFTDYLEHECDQRGDSCDVAQMVNELFDQFVDWAFDDLIISREEKRFLLSMYKWELRESIKKEILHEFIAA